MNESGIIKGPGGPKDDSIISIEEPGTLIVPIEKVEEAKRLYKKHINKEIPLAKPSKDGVVVKISNEEFKLTPEDLQIFIEKGVDISSILPDYVNNTNAGADGLLVEETPLKSLYDEFNPKLNLAKDYNEFKSLMEDKNARKNFFDEFNSELQLAKDYNEFEDVLGLKKKESSIPLPLTQEKLQEDSQKSPYQPASLQSESDSSTLKSEITPSESLKIPNISIPSATGISVPESTSRPVGSVDEKKKKLEDFNGYLNTFVSKNKETNNRLTEVSSIYQKQSDELNKLKGVIETANIPDDAKNLLVGDFNNQLEQLKNTEKILQDLQAKDKKESEAISLISRGKDIVQTSIDKRTSSGEVFARSLYNATVPTIVKGLGAATESVGDLASMATPLGFMKDEDTGITDLVGEELRGFGKAMEADIPKDSQKDVFDNFNLRTAANTGGQVLGNLLTLVGTGGTTSALGATSAISKATVLATAYTQSLGGLYEEAKSLGLSDKDAALLSTPLAIGIATLDAIPASGMAGKLNKSSAIKAFMKKAVDSGEKNFTMETASELASKTFKEVSKDFVKETSKEALQEGVTEGAQQALEIGGKQIYDLTQDEKVYGSDLFSKEGAIDIVKNAILGAVAGGAVGGAINITTQNRDVYNDLKELKENPSHIQNIEAKLSAEVKLGNIKEEEAAGYINLLDKVAGIDKKVPASIQDDDARLAAINLIEKKEALSEEVKGIDDALATPMKKELEVINNDLKYIAEGGNPKELPSLTIKPKEDAVQIESPTSVLQREQEITREEGSQRERMEPIKQGEEVAITNQEEIIPKENEKTKETTDQETLWLQGIEPSFEEKQKRNEFVDKKTKELQSLSDEEYIKDFIDSGFLNSINNDRSFNIRPYFKIPTADVKKAIEHIKTGKDSAPARKLREAILETKLKGEIPTIQGTGGMSDKTSVRLGEFRLETPIELTKEEVDKSESIDPVLSKAIVDNEITLDNFNEISSQIDWAFSNDELQTIKTYLENEQGIDSTTESVSETKGVTKKSTDGEEVQGEVETEGVNEEELRKSVEKGLSKKLDKIKGSLEPKSLSSNTAKDDAIKIVKNAFNPIKEGYDFINKEQEKTFGKITDKSKDWVANKIKEGNISSNNIKRQISQSVTSYNNGIPRTKNDLKQKRLLKGNISLAKNNFKEALSKMHALVDNNVESLEKIHQVLDPDVYKDKGILFEGVAKKEDLNENELALYNTLRDINDYLHDWNFSMGIIDLKTYLRNKGKYIARLYDPFEIPESAKKFLEQAEMPIGNKTVKLITELTKAREELDTWKRNNIVADPAYVTLKRMMETEINASVLSYIDHIASQKGLVSKTEKPGFTKLDGRGYGKLNGMYVPNYIAEDFTGFFFGNKVLDLIYDASKAYDANKLRQFIKKYHTIYDPIVQLGNATSNIVFGGLVGVDPITLLSKTRQAKSEIDNNTDNYKLLLKNGLMKSDVLTSDLIPLTKTTLELKKEADKIEKTLLEKGIDIASKADKKLTEIYGASDDIGKMAAFLALKDQGYTDEQAIEQVYNGFQNYSSVGKVWDFASKFPVLGNVFIKFQADLQRIMLNAATRRPLNTIMFLSTLKMIALLSSQASGEDEEKKEIRESRPFIPKIPNWFYGGAPLVFQTPIGEINAARYVSPFYNYDVGDLETPIENFARYMPFQVKLIDSETKGNKETYFPKQDPLLGVWYSAIIDDKDFRMKSIQDPSATKFKSSGATTTEKALNAANYILRSQFPLWGKGNDLYMTSKYGTDYYGRPKSPINLILDKFIKINEFKESDYKNVISNKFKAIEYNMEKLDREQQDIEDTSDSDLSKNEDLYKEGRITKEQYENKIESIYNRYNNKQADILEKMAKEQEKLNELTSKYSDFSY